MEQGRKRTSTLEYKVTWIVMVYCRHSDGVAKLIRTRVILRVHGRPWLQTSLNNQQLLNAETRGRFWPAFLAFVLATYFSRPPHPGPKPGP